VIVVVLGGARSGKSELAERRVTALAGSEPVTYVATALPDRADPSWTDRIARHRARRPQHWVTVDAGGDLAGLLAATAGPVLLDSLGPWVAAQVEAQPDGAALAEALAGRPGHTVVVSDEVGLSVHPPTAAGRWFVDALGTVNRAVAAVADEAWLVVAGRVVALAPEPVWPAADGPR